MSDTEQKVRVRVETWSSGGTLWCAGWLFTIAFAKLSLGKALLAIIVWPYFLGLAVR
jgi:hypothetical protein